jgi:hypothetical protein
LPNSSQKKIDAANYEWKARKVEVKSFQERPAMLNFNVLVT